MSRNRNKEYHNILVHQLMNIGDVLMATSAVALLRKAYPDATITMMVLPRCAEVVRNNPIIDEVIIFDYQSKQSSFKRMWAMVQKLRGKKFDLCVSLDFRLRPLIVTRLAGIPERISGDGLYKQQPWWVRKLYTQLIPIPQGTDYLTWHTSELFQHVVREFTGISEHALPVMANTGKENEEHIAQLLQTIPPNLYNIALCVRGTHPEKNWPQQDFAHLVEALSAQVSASFYIIGTQGDREYAQQIIDQCQCPIANFCGQTSLTDLVALMRKTDLLITVDTGAMHIAATTNVPIVGIFVCTNPLQWGPRCNDARLYYNPEGCARFGQVVSSYAQYGFCMGVWLEQIVAAAHKCLANRPNRAGE